MKGFESLPFELLFQIFSYLSSTRDLCACSLVCRSWRNVLDEDTIWDQLLEDLTPIKFRQSQLILELAGSKAKLVAFENAWNDKACSHNIYLKSDKLTLHRNPVAQSTDAIRGKCGYLYGQHYWKVKWHGPNLGSNAVVGVATEKELLQAPRYISLLGETCESWGWNVVCGVLRYDGRDITSYPHPDLKLKVSVNYQMV